MLTDIKFCKVQLSKTIPSRWFLRALSNKFAGSLMKVAAPFTRNVLAPLGPVTSTSAIDGAIQRKTFGRHNVREGKWIIFVNLNEDINDIIKIIKSLEFRCINWLN